MWARVVLLQKVLASRVEAFSPYSLAAPQSVPTGFAPAAVGLDRAARPAGEDRTHRRGLAGGPVAAARLPARDARLAAEPGLLALADAAWLAGALPARAGRLVLAEPARLAAEPAARLAAEPARLAAEPARLPGALRSRLTPDTEAALGRWLPEARRGLLCRGVAHAGDGRGPGRHALLPDRVKAGRSCAEPAARAAIGVAVAHAERRRDLAGDPVAGLGGERGGRGERGRGQADRGIGVHALVDVLAERAGQSRLGGGDQDALLPRRVGQQVLEQVRHRLGARQGANPVLGISHNGVQRRAGFGGVLPRHVGQSGLPSPWSAH